MNLDPVILHKLLSKRLFTAKDLLVATQLELVEALDISFEAAEHLVLVVSECIAPRASTVSVHLTGLASCQTAKSLMSSSNILLTVTCFCRPLTFMPELSSRSHTYLLIFQPLMLC